MRLTDTTAIVTGAASGIGRATAERFAEEGARVIVADIDAEGGEAVVDAIESDGGAVGFRELDVTDSGQFHAVVDDVAAGSRPVEGFRPGPPRATRRSEPRRPPVDHRP